MTFSTIEEVIQATYQAISGQNGTERNWELYKSLFLPNARLIIITDKRGEKNIEFSSPDAYISFFKTFVGERPFFEIETARKAELKDSFAVVWSDYETRIEKTGNVLYQGTNCFQLFNDNHRWWIASILWERKVKAFL